jgi:hypothetical protein
VYVPGGEGVIGVFQMNDSDYYRLLAKIPTALGGRTAGYFGRQSKGMHRFFLAVPARGERGTENLHRARLKSYGRKEEQMSDGNTSYEVNTMKKFLQVSVTALLFLCPPASKTVAQENGPLRLVQTIPMPRVKGRIDHMDVDVKGKRLFVPGLENGSLEVIDLALVNGRKVFPVSRRRRALPTFRRSIRCSWPAETTGWFVYFASIVWNYLTPSSWMALEIDPNYANALWFLALSLEQKGELPEAIVYL